jgi:hypothetical protein
LSDLGAVVEGVPDIPSFAIAEVEAFFELAEVFFEDLMDDAELLEPACLLIMIGGAVSSTSQLHCVRVRTCQ